MAKIKTGLSIGIATIDITPPIGGTMIGYSPRISNGIGHRLRGSAMVCKNGASAWLLACDTLGFDADITRTIREKVSRATGIKPSAIMVSGSHTHSGPVTLPLRVTPFNTIDEQYVKDLPDLLARVAKSAAKNARPGNFEVAWTEAPTLGANRRIRQANGAVVNEWEDPFGTHPGYYDPTILLIGVRRTGTAKREAILVNFGVHPVVLGGQSLKFSTDYVGYMRDVLEAQGDAGTVLFALSGAGNINPRTCIKVGAEYPRKMGESLAGIVSVATAKFSPVAGDRIAFHQEPWEFVRTHDALKGPGKKGDKVTTEIQIFRAGDLVLVSIPGELLSEFNRAFREASPFPHTAIITLANGYLGYLCTDAVMAEGAYEAAMAPAAGVEKMLTEHVQRAFAAIAD